ncbi:MAG: putative toxin-antitoxin system toxin component, PIN family [Cyanobium sp.]
MPSLGVVLDTNVLLSGLAYPASVPGKLIAAWRHGALNVVLSPHILEEVRRTLPKLNHRHGLTPQDIHDLIEAFTILAEVITPDAVSESELRDAADRPVLGTLLAALRSGAAQTLVTGDKDLLVLRDRYAICTPAEFWARHGGL